MLKKNEVLEILDNGGYILMNTIYRTANVYNASGIHEDNCRYDTADRIGHADGYTRGNGGWSYTDRIEKAAQEVKDDEPAQEAAQNEEENEINYFDEYASNYVAASMAAQEEPEQDEQQPDEIEQEPIYLDERVPTSNSIPGIFYRVTIETNHGKFCTDHYTVDDLQTYIQDAKHHGHPIRAAYRVNTETGERVPFVPETRQEQTDRENREHCKRIADELDAYVDGSVYRCPYCDEEITWSNARYDDETNAYTCQHCGQEFDADELEALGLHDYLADALDIDYTINGSDRDTVKSVRVMVAFGGPTIYIDSASRAVELYWWTDSASYPISSDAADALDEWAQELWSCC